MRFLPPAAALAVLLAAADVRAGILTSATWETGWRGWNADVSFTVPLTASGTSTATGVSVSVAVAGFASSVTLPFTPITSPRATLTLDGVQQISATAGMASATMGLPGARITRTKLAEFLNAPLDVGVSGLFTSTFVVLGVQGAIRVDHLAWTPGTVTLTGLTSNYAPLPDVVAMGSFALTGMGGGTVTLVSPAKITHDGIRDSTTVSLTTLTLHFVPEPGSLLLLAATAVALTAARRLGRLD